jgi:hypothetical protein
VIPWVRLAAVGAVLAGVAGSYWWTYTEGKAAGSSEMAAAVARAQAIAIEARDAEQARIIKEQQDAAVRADKARDAAEVARLAAGDAVGRLQQRAADLAARACPGAATAPIGAAEAGPVVLADVLGRLAAAGGRVAAAADDARNRGDECAARYDALRPR